MDVTGLAFLFLTGISSVAATVEVKIGMLHQPGNFQKFISDKFLLPAAEIAIEAIAERIRDGNYSNFTMTFENRNASRRTAGAVAASLHYQDGVDAFIGPPASYDTEPVADMAAVWNLPILTGVSTSTRLEDKTRFRTLTRTAPSISLLVGFLEALIESNGWKKFAIVRSFRVNDSRYYSNLIPSAIFNTLEAKGIVVIEIVANQYTTWDEALQLAASEAEVIFLSTTPVADVMVRAHRLGLTGGSHTFLYWYPFDFSGWNTSSQFDNLDAESIEALRALFVIRTLVSDTVDYHEFHAKMRAKQHAMFGDHETEECWFSATWHDALLVYADVINDVVAEGGNVRDGEAITNRMRNRTFQGVTGPIRINGNGDRYGRCEILGLTDLKTGEFNVVGTYDEATGYGPVNISIGLHHEPLAQGSI